MNILNKIAIVIATIALLIGCDPQRKKKCEWYLVPEIEHKHLVEPGWVSLCARNFYLKKQKCYYSATLKSAEEIYGQAFTLTSLQFEDGTFPRKVVSFQPCTPSRVPVEMQEP